MSLNFTKQEEVDGGADLPTLATAYITYKIGKLRNLKKSFKKQLVTKSSTIIIIGITISRARR